MVFEHGKEYCESFYGSDCGYAFQIYSRVCPYKRSNHISDITIGDYWRIGLQDAGYNRYGTLLLVHSKQGEKLLSGVETNIFKISDADIEKVLRNNTMYFKSRRKTQNLEYFKNCLITYGLHRVVVKHVGVAKYYSLRVLRYINKVRMEIFVRDKCY